MSQKPAYPNIDMQRTGRRLKHMIESAGYTPRSLGVRYSKETMNRI